MILALCEKSKQILYQPVAWNGNMVEYLNQIITNVAWEDNMVKDLIQLHIYQLPWGGR